MTEPKRVKDVMAENEKLRAKMARLLVEGLRDAIRFHAHLYYNLDRNEISDAEYDRMFNELKRIESEHPELRTPESPTQLVGEAISAPLRERR